MIPPITDEQIAGLALHEKERKEICDKVLEKYKKPDRVKSKESEEQEKLKKWKQR